MCLKDSNSSRRRTLASEDCTIARLASQSPRSEEHTSELQSQSNLECRLLLEKKEQPTISGSVANTAALLIPCSAKIDLLAIAGPTRPAPIRPMLCCPCVRTTLRNSLRSDSML